MNSMHKLLAACVLLSLASTASAYDFVISNATKSKMTEVNVSEDGKNWLAFDIGKGIAAGGSMKVTWSSHLDNSGCQWKVKASYADGSESAPTAFDFCEENLELKFTE